MHKIGALNVMSLPWLLLFQNYYSYQFKYISYKFLSHTSLDVLEVSYI